LVTKAVASTLDQRKRARRLRTLAASPCLEGRSVYFNGAHLQVEQADLVARGAAAR
jgi:hypothetical protein